MFDLESSKHSKRRFAGLGCRETWIDKFILYFYFFKHILKVCDILYFRFRPYLIICNVCVQSEVTFNKKMYQNK